MSIEQSIRDIRMKRDVFQEALAELLDVSRQTRLQTGKRPGPPLRRQPDPAERSAGCASGRAVFPGTARKICSRINTGKRGGRQLNHREYAPLLPMN